MKENADAIVLGIVLGFLLGSRTAWAWTSLKMESDFRLAAIEAGVAEYVLVDPASGKTEFRWKAKGGGDATE